MKIVVPSLGRAGTAASAVWLQQQRREVVFAVHKDEYTSYERAYPWATVWQLSDESRRHAGRVRKEIMEMFKDRFFFCDDDVYVRLVRAKSYDQMFDYLEAHLEKVPMAGIGKQIFSQGLVAACKPLNGDPLTVRDKFVSLVYGVHAPTFRDCPLEKLQVYEDVALILHAIRRGGTIVSFSATHTNKTPPEGGCNSWRTEEIVLQSLDALCAAYPAYCRKVATKSTAHGHDLGVGVRVAWSKASRDGHV